MFSEKILNKYERPTSVLDNTEMKKTLRQQIPNH